MKVGILAGFGTRLAEETEVRLEPIIGGMEILWHIMMQYDSAVTKSSPLLFGTKANPSNAPSATLTLTVRIATGDVTRYV